MKRILLIAFITINLFAGERIVTLSPSLNEIVFALGSGKNIVANTYYSDYPEESKKIPKIGGYASISLEKLLISKPTIVLTQNYDQQLLQNLKKLKLNFYSFKTDNLDSIKKTISSIGKILKKENKSLEIISKIDKSLLSLKNITKDKSFMIVISPRFDLNKSIYIAGNNLYFNDIINISGNYNAYKSLSLSQPVVNVEKIINMNPDVIVLLAPYINKIDSSKDRLKNIWKKLPITASRNSDIYIIDKEYAGIPSNRVVDFINDFKKILKNVRDK
ncbi:MAG: ABC transporter substrate-binding protein [Arcobacter sp.]|nr:ABC transporter substrate-binding protein [Arcobacter sp.]